MQPRGINRSPSSSYTYKGGAAQSSFGGANQSQGHQSSFVSPGKQTAKEAMRRARKPLSMKHCTSIIDGLKTIYFNKVGLHTALLIMRNAELTCKALKDAPPPQEAFLGWAQWAQMCPANGVSAGNTLIDACKHGQAPKVADNI